MTQHCRTYANSQGKHYSICSSPSSTSRQDCYLSYAGIHATHCGRTKQGKSAETSKDFCLPQKIWMVPEGNDFNNPDSEFSFLFTLLESNILLRWEVDNKVFLPHFGDKSKA